MKIEPYVNYLRERWEQGVHNGAKLFSEIQKRGYTGGYTQLREFVKPWRAEERQRAYVRFETCPGEQSQLDWGHFGNWNGARLYGFALTLCRVHPDPGRGNADELHGAGVPLLRWRDRKSS